MLRQLTRFDHEFRQTHESSPPETVSDISQLTDPRQQGRSGLLSRLSPATRQSISTALDRVQTYGRGGAAIVVARTFHLGGSFTGPCAALLIDHSVSHAFGKQGAAATAWSDLRFVSRRAIDDLRSWRQRRSSSARTGDVDLEEGIPLVDMGARSSTDSHY